MPNFRRVTLSLDDDTKNRLEAASKQSGVPQSQIIKNLVAQIVLAPAQTNEQPTKSANSIEH